MKKRTFCFAVFILLYFVGYAQAIVYCDIDKEPVSDSSQAVMYKVIVKDSANLQRVKEQFHLMSGALVEEESFIDYSDKKKSDGVNRKWYNTGQLKLSVDYVSGVISGNITTYWENGQLKRKDIYKNGDYQFGECYDKDGKKIKHFDYLVYPHFPGGDSKLMGYIGSNLKYPQNAADEGVQGQVYLLFKVNLDGSISDISVWRGCTFTMNLEAIRVLKGMPKWVPGKIDGEPSTMKTILAFGFKLAN